VYGEQPSASGKFFVVFAITSGIGPGSSNLKVIRDVV
jgi:hypothetical protein